MNHVPGVCSTLMGSTNGTQWVAESKNKTENKNKVVKLCVEDKR